MSDFSPIKAKLDAKVDLTESANKITNTIVTPFQYLTKGVKKICVAWGGRMIAKSERHNMLEQAQNEKDAEDIKSGKKEYRDGILLNTQTMQSPQDYYKQISEHNEYCDAERLNAALLEAAIELSNTPDEEISGDPLDKTFFNRWRAEAELIDDEDLRKWWAHLLVEETKKPNSISPRTLDVVKNLSKSEAKLFEKLSVGIIEDCSLFIDDDGTSLLGSYSDVLILQDAGLISSRRSTHPIDKQKVIFSHGMFVVELLDRENHEISCHALTVAGQELCRILCNSMILDSELYEFAEKIKNICKCNVNLFKIDSKTYIPGTSEVKIKCADKPLHQTLYWEEI